MGVRAARSLESGVRTLQAFAQLPAAGNDEMFVRSPSSGGIALLLHKREAVLDGPQVLRIAEYQISLGGRTQRIHVTVRVFARQRVFASRERIEKLVVEEEPLG